MLLTKPPVRVTALAVLTVIVPATLGWAIKPKRSGAVAVMVIGRIIVALAVPAIVLVALTCARTAKGKAKGAASAASAIKKGRTWPAMDLPVLRGGIAPVAAASSGHRSKITLSCR